MAASDRAVSNEPTQPATPEFKVKPRTRATKPLPVVAIGSDYFLAESGETGSFAELVEQLPTLSPTLFCAVGAADIVAMFTSTYLLRTPDSWQVRASAHERNVCAPTDTFRAARVSTAIHFFGWKRAKNDGYHKIIDPVVLYGQGIDDIWPHTVSVVDDPEWQKVTKLLKWGIELRDFCHKNGVDVRPTLGSIASQFLTDRRFYPDARRKVPAKINQRARENLPGNHYFLNVKASPHTHYEAYYLDQHRAHHYHARTTALPDSNHCYAYGRFIDLEEISFADTIPEFSGLYCLDLEAPKRIPPFMWTTGGERQFVYSCELPHLRDAGYGVLGVRAAWGSLRQDTGLKGYATWAEKQLDAYGDPAWLKPLLLATYGTLATRPVTGESIFRLAKTGTPVRIKTGARELGGLLVRSTRKLEPKIAHVLQRGMIEAACRSESVGLAQWLDSEGYTVLSIYADAVMVEADDDKPLPPILIDPWRCKRELRHLRFINRQAFTSDSMTKLPGIGRELLAYRQKTMPGYAPRRVSYEALTNKPVRSGRRI